MQLQTEKQMIYALIDDLKAICSNYGLGNSGNEYKIITEAFLYKFLNDKFLAGLKELPDFAGKSTQETERRLAELSEDDFDFLMMDLDPRIARIHPADLISSLFSRKGEQGFHTIFDNALLHIAEANKEVFSVAAGAQNRVRLFDTLSNLVTEVERQDDFCRAIINKLNAQSFDAVFQQKYDFYADIFEYLIKDYNKDSGQYAEYYTPHSIAQIIARIIAPHGAQNVSIYDPAAGSGTLVLTLAEQIGEENCTVYTQDISQKSNEVLRLNLILNNLVDSLPHVIQDDTLVRPRHLSADGKSIEKFAYIVSNPPFNTDFSETRDQLAGEGYKKRFFAGVPNIPKKKKESMAIYQMFLQHIIVSMQEHGKAAIVVPTGFLTAATGIPYKIRQHIVQKKLLRGVVSMPSNIFANTGTNVSVLFLDAAGTEDDKVLLVDASNMGEKVKLEGTKNQRTYLSQAEMDKIVQTMNERQEIDDFSVLVSLKDIEQKKCSFSAGQYFKVKIEYIDLTPEEFQQKMADYEQQLKAYFAEGHKLEEEILKGLGELKFD
ncbi:class I SAM-dependent DNA methyltransferase [Selenomonas ruminantium]|uniref:HsdM family class I SAM-dependent methyltransferase n=1 Tax=Selenomonas ruminantium TaxID=971 RepID=UPI0026EB8AF8|nr:class I SAM-dependent DNA methyltransferase [Selenomonas ruminantium]